MRSSVPELLRRLKLGSTLRRRSSGEECYFALLNFIHARTGQKKLCLAGGVALYCVANGLIFGMTPFIFGCWLEY